MSVPKKIGLLTCHRIPNHGSYLQAWSLCEYLSRQGYDVEIIDYIYPNLYHLNYVQNGEIKRNTNTSNLLGKFKRYIIDRWFVCNRKRGLELLIYKILNIILRIPNKLYFRQLKLSKKSYISPNELKSSKLEYDILLSGSDQIWNPRFTGCDGSFFLQFGNKRIKRIAYSSSFGVAKLQPEYCKLYAKWLKKFSHIATREQSGVKIIESLIKRPAVHVLDPVMLFNKVQWSEILTVFKNIEQTPIDKPYIVSYCLDYVYKGIIKYADNIMESIANAQGLQCLTLYKSNIGNNKVRRFQETIHPFEFVNVIMHANYALVSSFHGLAFCLLFHTPFLVIIDRKNTTDSRLLDLLETFELTDRVLTVGEQFDETSFDIPDWENIDKIYNRMTNISKQYLKKALND